MLDLFYEINYLAVLVAGVAGFAIAGLWYSKMLFANAWMEENGFKESDLADPKPAMISGFLSNVVLAFGLASVFLMMQLIGTVLGSSDPGINIMEGAWWGFFLAVLIHGAAGFPNYAFESRSFTLFLIHVGNSALGMAVMGAILAYMN